MAIGSNNKFPKVILTEQSSTPANPDSGDQKLFIRTSDHVLCRVNSSGTVTPIEGAASSIPVSGWVDQTAVTWTRTGNHTFTISGDVTVTYRKGTKVRYKDGGAYEYGIVINSSYSAPNTTVTLATNNDYAMAAGTITDNYISHIDNPEGWPDWFNYTPTLGANGSMTWTSTSIARAVFRVSGKTVQFFVSATGTIGGTPNNALTATLPIETSSAVSWGIYSIAQDSSGEAGMAFFTLGTPDIVSVRRYNASNYTSGSNRGMSVGGFYVME